MDSHQPKISLSGFALITGIAMIGMSSSPFAEFMVYDKLVVAENPTETAKNILAHQTLFSIGILSYLFNFIGDIVVAWALYGLFKPVNAALSLLTAWFQLIYAAISLVATINLVTVLRLLNNPEYLKVFGTTQLYTQAWLTLHAFRDGWSLAFFFFGINLVLRGYLTYRSGYIPKWVGICLIVAGLGYFVNTIQPFLFPNATIPYITVTYFGELVFMLWLLIKGWKIRNVDQV
jgi:hypothetical protein